MADWQTLLKSFNLANARCALHTAEWPEGENPPMEWQDELERLSEDYCIALKALLLSPAPSFTALAEKLKVIADEEIAYSWYLRQEAITLAALDAKRLLSQ